MQKKADAIKQDTSKLSAELSDKAQDVKTDAINRADQLTDDAKKKTEELKSENR